MMQDPYDYFEAFKIVNYWYIQDEYEGYGVPFAIQQPGPALSVFVCLVTATLPLLVALWIFRRRSY